LISFRKNQKAVRYMEDHGKKATRIYPRALGDDAFKPTIGGLTLQGGGSTGGVIDIGTYETDQLKGLYLELVGDSTRRLEITGSSTLTASQTTITYSSAAAAVYFPAVVPVSTSLGPGSIFHHLVETSTGRRLVYIPRSTGSGRLSSVVLDRQDIPAITNTMAGGVRAGTVTLSGGATTTTVIGPSPFVHLGDRSRKITLPSAGDSVTFHDQIIGGVSEEKPHLSMQTNFYLESGRLGVQFSVGPFVGGTAVVFPASTDGTPTYARATAIEAWHDLAIAPGAFSYYDHFGTGGSFTSHGFLLGSITYASLSTSSGPTVAYVDSRQVVNEAVPADQIVDGSAARKLWDASIELLRSGLEEPARLLDVDAVDLGRLSTQDYPGDAFVYGQNVKLFDPGIGVDYTRRVKARIRDLKVSGNTVLELFDAS
jgi:hypothetical protein